MKNRIDKAKKKFIGILIIGMFDKKLRTIWNSQEILNKKY